MWFILGFKFILDLVLNGVFEGKGGLDEREVGWKSL